MGGDEKQLNRDVIPHIGNLTVGSVARRDIAKLIDRVADRGSPIASNRLLACISTMFNWAIREGYIEDNPARMISKRGVEQSRERILNDEEIRIFWNGIATASPMSEAVRDLLRLGLLTGQRRG
jgi:integrase